MWWAAPVCGCVWSSSGNMVSCLCVHLWARGEASWSLNQLVWAPFTPSLLAQTRWGVEQSAKFINLSNLLCCNLSTKKEPFDNLSLICHPVTTVYPLWETWLQTPGCAPPISQSSLNTGCCNQKQELKHLNLDKPQIWLKCFDILVRCFFRGIHI